MRTLVYSLIFSIPGASLALAHGGHVGELAGHSHWVGWAAAAAAGAIAAWAIKRGTRKKSNAQNNADEAESDARPDSAEA
ncbi:hypothetical protein PZ897_05510 [Hoeflea sp. YIM 152468]|uniref:DUF6732 family protein n=1 Tax=Hoeflea sp. YIM 152468 TaxID=3031759 RepID=UPI0023DA4773|nr:DUF6732 family protein [Hoeflea sp. YIM 152468]MDF1607628.1 hypothetical protein [Hoeflea sp. YIM 152468]